MAETLTKRGVGITPEYPVIKDYVTEALTEERGASLEQRHKRSVGYIARYLALFTLKPSEQGRAVAELDKVVIKSRGSLRYSVWVENKAKELLPGWMGVRMVTRQILEEQQRGTF